MNYTNELPDIITKDDPGHIDNHVIIHRSIKDHESRLANSSGFPLKVPNEVSRNDKKEVGLLRNNSNHGEAITIAEVTDSSGILKHIWFAAQCPDPSFLLNKGQVRIYVDNATTPSIVNDIGMFFPSTNIGENYSNNRIGHADGNGQENSSSGYRYLHVPFQNYLRVEMVNHSSESALIYGSAQYNLLDSIESMTQQKQYKMSSTGSVVNNNDNIVILEETGSGQIESIIFKYLIDKSDQDPVLEGPVNIWIDGVLAQRFSGIEDLFNGGWYKVPEGAYPAGITANNSPEGYTLYRFFENAPIFFDESIKITVGIGQVGQGVVNESKPINFMSSVGYWVNEFADIVAPSLGEVIYSTEFNDMNGWFNAGDRTPFQIQNGKAVVTAAGTQADEDARLFRPEMTLPSDYWIQTRVRLVGEGEEEAFLGIEGAYDVFYGSAVHVQVKKHQSGAYEVQAKDDFDILFTEVITNGTDIDWVYIALRKYKGKVAAYTSFDGNNWSPLGNWTPTKSGSSIAIGAWNTSAEFDNLVIKSIV